MAVTTSPADAIQLTIPLRSEYGSILRLVAAASGADAEFSLDDIDDLRLAVSEVFSSALQHEGSAATLTAVFTRAAPGVQVSLLVSSEGGSPTAR
jgi:serine/threonine-protein kinase RsbW